MRIAVARRWVDAMLAHAAAEYPREACGLLLGTPGHVAVAERTRNIAPDPERGFEIDPAALLGAQRAARAGGPALIGWYHAHPNGLAEPSATDAARAREEGRWWLIVANGALHAFVAEAGGPLHGRFAPAEITVV